jgi:hypothetical protein
VVRIEGQLAVPGYLDFPILIIFLVVLIWLTINKAPAKFLEFKQDVLDLSVGDYQQLMLDVKKYYRNKKMAIKAEVEADINRRLEKIGAKLKK